MKAGATHLIGSEMYYEDLGNGNYLITLKVYRECGPANTQGTDFDDIIFLGVFESATNQLQQVVDVFLNFGTVLDVPVIMTNPCGTPPPDLCVEEATYTTTLMLGSSPAGYEIAWQRCCRNPSISNLANAGGTDNPGMTATIQIPGSLQTTTNNSSPVFQEFPPVALCANFGFFFDHSAIDSDGDELVYSFCAPFDGGGANGAGGGPASPVPNPPSNPPYAPIPYNAAYSATYPIASDPAFSIDPATGFITGTPNIPGQYAMGICVEEFRDGISLGKVVRDFQFNVTLCDANIVAAVMPQQPEQLCIGETLQFENNSINGDDFIWDFGVSDTDSDVSTEFEPEFTFPDVGTYTVTLIANPTWPCADTSSQTFDVFMPLDPEIEIADFNCIQGTETFDFEVTGTMNNEATYFWDFGATGSPVSANIPTPVGVDFSNDDNWNVTLTVNNHGCTADAEFLWIAPEQPTASIEDQEGFCQGLTFTFENNSTNAETYLWDFGSPFGGDSSTEPEPEFTYSDSGSYTVTLTAYAPFTCPDFSTANVEIQYLLEPSFPTPDPDCFSSHNFSMTGTASVDNNTVYTWEFGGETATASTNDNAVLNLQYAEPGVYDVTLTAEVPGLQGCQQSYTAQVEAIADPTVDFSAGPLLGCPPHQVSFTNLSTTSTATTYLWHFGDGNTSTSANTVHIYNGSGDFTVELQMTTGGYCERTLNKLEVDLVRTYPIPFAAFDVTPNVVDILDPIVQINYIGDEDVDCFYNFGDGGSLQGCDGEYLYSDGGFYDITLTVINAAGCTNTAAGQVSVSGSVFYAPTAFTPDGDGLNDVWIPVVLGVSAYRLRIVNRWGEIVWETLDSLTPWLGEKGNESKHFCPNGLYIWEAVWIDQIGYPRTKSGSVYLTR
jgi:PKD repeat protein